VLLCLTTIIFNSLFQPLIISKQGAEVFYKYVFLKCCQHWLHNNESSLKSLL
jgi:hypothetical protein